MNNGTEIGSRVEMFPGLLEDGRPCGCSAVSLATRWGRYGEARRQRFIKVARIGGSNPGIMFLTLPVHFIRIIYFLNQLIKLFWFI